MIILLEIKTKLLINCFFFLFFCCVINDWKEDRGKGWRKRLGQHKQIVETTMPVCDVYIYRPHVL